MIAYMLLKGGGWVYILIFVPIFLVLFILFITNKIYAKRQQIKRERNLKKILLRAKNEKWIRINIKDTKYTVKGFTNTSHDDGYSLNETSVYGGLDRQFSTHQSWPSHSALELAYPVQAPSHYQEA